MSGQDFYFLTLIYGLKKLTDICSKIDKDINFLSLEDLIQSNNYLKSNKELIKKLYEPKANDIYIQLIKESEKIIGKEINFTSENPNLFLEPIFNKVFQFNKDSNKKYFYEFKPLNLENIFPQEYIKKDKDTIIRDLNYHLNSLKVELEKVDNNEKLYYLLQKYLWCISIGKSSVSLFDYIKSISCIALCLYEQYTSGEFEMENSNSRKHFLLINGDISGIQDFIFNISSKGAAKSLKGRSVYLNLLLEIVVKYIIDELDLYDTNLVYNGGGNFYIIAPATKKEKLNSLKQKLSEKLLEAHNGEIYIALSYIELKPNDFNDFSNNWKKVSEETAKFKRVKWGEINLQSKDNYEKIFGPLDKGSKDKDNCSVCGITSSIRNIKSISDEEKICNLCDSFRDLTDKLKDAKYISFSKVEKEPNPTTYNNIFSQFGYKIDLHKESTKELPKVSNNHSIYIINSTDYLEKDCSGYKFGAYNLPIKFDEDEKKERILTFEELAQRSIKDNIGDKKLGYLKLDVDNLGSIFINGLKENKSIIQIASLSRMLGLFFEGYINKLLEELELENKIYIVFSGGDDTFIIGAWNSTFLFSTKLYENFRKYTCKNPSITFSASLGVYRYNYPVVRAAANAEEDLENAKSFKKDREEKPQKNKVSLFGQVFNWTEFKKIIEIKDFLVDLIIKEDKRSILDKVMRSTKGFKKIMEDSTKNKIDNIRFWRLAYYLRDIEDKDSSEKLIKYYREIVIDNLLNKSKDENIENIMIIPASVRWAELETKKN